MKDHNAFTPKRIAVGVDGSASSKAALQWAARIACATGCGIDAITAWEYPASYGWMMAPAGWPSEADSITMAQRTVDEVFGEQRPTDVQVVCTYGPARTVLLDASKDAQMLIVGSRGHGGFASLLLGSVSAACAEHAHCPVLIVHEEPSPSSKESSS